MSHQRSIIHWKIEEDKNQNHQQFLLIHNSKIEKAIKHFRQKKVSSSNLMEIT